MIIKTKDFQESCKKILEAVDTTSKQMLDDTLELTTRGNKLHLNVTNGEYYVSVIFGNEVSENIHATIKANTFLNLISKITTEELELNLISNALTVKANGTYKFPFIFNASNEMYTPKEINVDNVTTEFTMTGDNLLSILNYNNKELGKGAITKSIQKMFYLDEQGCITFTTGACVNSFELEKPVKMLLNTKLVKLFKLFDKDESVKVAFGYDEEGGVVKSKVKFETDSVIITSVLTSDESLINSVPVKAIRKRAFEEYKFNVEINKEKVLSAIDRLSIFEDSFSSLKIELTPSSLVIKDIKEENVEYVEYGEKSPSEDYSFYVNLKDFKLTLDSCVEQFVTLSYGNSQSIVITRGLVRNIIPEGHLI